MAEQRDRHLTIFGRENIGFSLCKGQQKLKKKYIDKLKRKFREVTNFETTIKKSPKSSILFCKSQGASPLNLQTGVKDKGIQSEGKYPLHERKSL